MDGLFRPSPIVRAAVAAYMRSHGFHPTGNGMLTMSFTGAAAQAETAFGVTLNHYRLAGGTGYRAPSGAIHLPPALARRVISVDGLSTLPLMHPLGLHGVHHKAGGVKPLTSLSDCTFADNVQTSNPGSLQPADLAGATAYNSATRVSAGDDGTGESVALVEFSGYHGNDLAGYQSCYGTTVQNIRVNVNGGTPADANGGSIEVALDQEVLAGEAPGLNHIYTFVAPQSTSMAGILDAIYTHHTAEGVHIVSDSWGNCEGALLEASQAANNRELQLMAVAGMSFYAASGDDGSSDCHRSLGFDGLQVDDPAVQPYATGVGGTKLNPGVSETVWGGHGASAGGGGGGVSLSFTKPSWQVGTGVIRVGQSSKTKCGGKTRWCREVPDVAFDADPTTGYIINAQDNFGWDVVGGTSAAAPLMAAFTADANRFSLQNGGGRMGFANPFLYHEAKVDPSMFHDVTVGKNNIVGGSMYPAGAGYDLASGLGSVNVQMMATDLANYTRSAVKVHGTKITAGASVNPVTAAHATMLSGTLRDVTSHTPLGGRVVWIEGFIGSNPNPVFIRLHTGRKGAWAKKLTRKQITRKFVWHAVYVGEQGHRPAVSPVHTLKVG
jgi:subtilase family serine protease